MIFTQTTTKQVKNNVGLIKKQRKVKKNSIKTGKRVLFFGLYLSQTMAMEISSEGASGFNGLINLIKWGRR